MEMPRSGLAGAVTCTPLACSCSTTSFQPEASAKAPCTKTTVRGASALLVCSDIVAPCGSRPCGLPGSSFKRATVVVDLNRNLCYECHLPTLTFDLLGSLLGGRCKSVAGSPVSEDASSRHLGE